MDCVGIPNPKYKINYQIGKGSYGAVFLCTCLLSGEQVAMKQVEIKEETNIQQNRMEMKVLSKLQHPNIVKYFDDFIDEDGKYCIVMEYCGGGDLAKTIENIKNLNSWFPEETILLWFTQLTMAIAYMHSQNILHRDLKPSNVYLSSENLIKLGDFGTSKYLFWLSSVYYTRTLSSVHALASTVIGTPYILSPEICKSEPYSFATDIWSLGCILYELLSLKKAFVGENLMKLVWSIVQTDFVFDPLVAEKYSSDVVQLVKKLLLKDSSARPTASEILKMPFLDSYVQNITILNSGLVSAKRSPNRSPSSHPDVSTRSQDINSKNNHGELEAPIKNLVLSSPRFTSVEPQRMHLPLDVSTPKFTDGKTRRRSTFHSPHAVTNPVSPSDSEIIGSANPNSAAQSAMNRDNITPFLGTVLPYGSRGSRRLSVNDLSIPSPTSAINSRSSSNFKAAALISTPHHRRVTHDSTALSALIAAATPKSNPSTMVGHSVSTPALPNIHNTPLNLGGVSQLHPLVLHSHNPIMQPVDQNRSSANSTSNSSFKNSVFTFSQGNEVALTPRSFLKNESNLVDNSDHHSSKIVLKPDESPSSRRGSLKVNKVLPHPILKPPNNASSGFSSAIMSPVMTSAKSPQVAFISPIHTPQRTPTHSPPRNYRLSSAGHASSTFSRAPSFSSRVSSQAPLGTPSYIPSQKLFDEEDDLKQIQAEHTEFMKKASSNYRN